MSVELVSGIRGEKVDTMTRGKCCELRKVDGCGQTFKNGSTLNRRLKNHEGTLFKCE